MYVENLEARKKTERRNGRATESTPEVQDGRYTLHSAGGKCSAPWSDRMRYAEAHSLVLLYLVLLYLVLLYTGVSRHLPRSGGS